MINSEKVKSLSEKYNFKVKDMENGIIHITSKFDEWYAKSNNKFISIHHKNTKAKTDKYHLQKKVDNIESVFELIYEHDVFVAENRYKKSYYNRRLDYLFNLISTKNKIETAF